MPNLKILSIYILLKKYKKNNLFKIQGIRKLPNLLILKPSPSYVSGIFYRGS